MVTKTSALSDELQTHPGCSADSRKTLGNDSLSHRLAFLTGQILAADRLNYKKKKKKDFTVATSSVIHNLLCVSSSSADTHRHMAHRCPYKIANCHQGCTTTEQQQCSQEKASCIVRFCSDNWHPCSAQSPLCRYGFHTTW